MAGQIAAAMTTAAEMEARQALLAERTRSLHLAQESELALREREDAIEPLPKQHPTLLLPSTKPGL
jgi:hypothetical protein